MNPEFSFVIPVYNRPQEIKELLTSFAALTYSKPYEIVIVEDGSDQTSEAIVASFQDKLNLAYFFKPNSGPGDSRNYGMRKAKGDYFIVLDSDVLLPPHYLSAVADFLSKDYYHCYGGPDAADSSFSDVQKAINYAMTSFLTTGGIRGDKRSALNFEPRSFNMGISKEAFERTGGFAKIHPGEDPDLSHRIKKSGFRTTFIPEAFVYHKRRISWRKFYTQVRKFGLVRPILTKWHPESARLSFWFPAFFLFFVIVSILLCIIIHWLLIMPLVTYLVFILLDASIRNRSLKIGGLTVVAVFIQFMGYGLGFIESTWYVRMLNKQPEMHFPQLFFK